MGKPLGPAGTPAGTPAGQQVVRCSRCRKPIAGRAWRSITGRIVCDDCTQGWTYLSGQIQDAARDEPPGRPDDTGATRTWRRALRRKG